MGEASEDGYFKSWYAANKDDLNRRRREKYARDKDRRDKAVEYQRAYRKDKVRASSSGQQHFREVAGKKVEVHRISATAELVGCSVEFIRKYEKQGVIPASVVPSKQRYYLPHQVALIKDLFDLMVQLKYSKDEGLKALALQNQTQVILSKWTGE